MKKYFSTIFAVFCFVVLAFCVGVSGARPEWRCAVNEDILRFHILANSDEDCDQILKLKVKDAIMPVIRELFEGCGTVGEALAVANNSKTVIENAAKEVIKENKSTQDVHVFVGKEYYPERKYEGCKFPEGEYLSLRVILGKGKGHNWWCVLFPSIGNVGVVYDSQAENSENEKKILGCRIKFKFLEYFE